jgi:tetratricopeptide (TPR) repeat protein
MKEEVGKLDVAEQLYCRALAAPPSPPEKWPASTADGCIPPSVRGWDARSALADFLAERGRFDEADKVLCADPAEEYVDQRMRLYRLEENWDRVIALQRELVKQATDKDTLEAREDELYFLLVESGQIQEDPVNDTGHAAADSRPPQDALSKITKALDAGDLDRAKNLAQFELPSNPFFGMMFDQFSQVAHALHAAGRTDDARAVLDRYLSKAEETYGVGSTRALLALSDCIHAYATAGLVEDGSRLLSRLELGISMLQGAPWVLAENVLERRADLLSAQGKEKDATDVQQQWLDLVASTHGSVSAHMAAAHRRLAERRAETGRHEQARDEWLTDLDILRKLTGNYGYSLAEELVGAARYFKSQGWIEEAAKLIQEAEAVAPPKYRKEILSRAQ